MLLITDETLLNDFGHDRKAEHVASECQRTPSLLTVRIEANHGDNSTLTRKGRLQKLIQNTVSEVDALFFVANLFDNLTEEAERWVDGRALAIGLLEPLATR